MEALNEWGEWGATSINKASGQDLWPRTGEDKERLSPYIRGDSVRPFAARDDIYPSLVIANVESGRQL